MTFLSRVLGFVRDMVAAHYFGAGSGYDAFIVASKIPNFMRRLFAEGAFAQAFVPLLSEYKGVPMIIPGGATPDEARAIYEYFRLVDGKN